MADQKPVDIGAMPNLGASRDGKVIFFDFFGNDGVTYKFKVTHEAIGTIVDNLIKGAEEAERLRGNTFKAGQVLKGRPFESKTFVTGISPDGEKAVLVLESTGRQALSIQLSREQCSALSLALAQLSSQLGPAPDPAKPAN